jgi:hypothetical protein
MKGKRGACLTISFDPMRAAAISLTSPIRIASERRLPSAWIA